MRFSWSRRDLYVFSLFCLSSITLRSMVYLNLRGISRYKLSSIFLPFVISSLTASLMDYNRVMSDVTFVLMMYVLLVFFLIIPKRRVYHQLIEITVTFTVCSVNYLDKAVASLRSIHLLDEKAEKIVLLADTRRRFILS